MLTATVARYFGRSVHEQRDGIYLQDDGAEVSNSINNSPAEFEVFYHGHGNAVPIVVVNFTTLSTLNNPAGTSIQLEWGP